MDTNVTHLNRAGQPTSVSQLLRKAHGSVAMIPFLFAVSGANATPAITSVQGTYANGQNITISGSGFGSGPHVEIYDDFENGAGSPGTVIPLTSPEVGQWTDYGQTVGRPRYHSLAASGSHGWAINDKTYIQYPKDDSNRMGQFIKVFSNPVQEIFISYQVAVPTGTNFSGASTPNTFPNVSSWKFFWVYDGPTGYNSDGKADMCLPTHVGYGSFMLAGNDGNLISLGNTWWSWNGFNRMSVWLRANSANPSGGNCNILYQVTNAEKGTTQIIRNDLPVFPAGATTQWDRATMPGWWGNGDWSNFDGVYDDVYIASGPNAAARVEIGDAATYTASKHLTILTPQSWTGTQIIATVRAGQFSTFNGTYLYVTDSNNNVSSGIPVTVCSQCPSAPQNVQVN